MFLHSLLSWRGPPYAEMEPASWLKPPLAWKQQTVIISHQQVSQAEQWVELPVFIQAFILLLLVFCHLLATIGHLVEDPGSNSVLQLQNVLKRHVGQL